MPRETQSEGASAANVGIGEDEEKKELVKQFALKLGSRCRMTDLDIRVIDMQTSLEKAVLHLTQEEAIASLQEKTLDCFMEVMNNIKGKQRGLTGLARKDILDCFSDAEQVKRIGRGDIEGAMENFRSSTLKVEGFSVVGGKGKNGVRLPG